ncbi:uncharacterized protein LOC113285687 [Papaver somniferum]|uniref:uncharacterized protein LOC113285687 n=1 Tax=Papaver somniferum TaxID=3469 RepID=UPI000E6F9459|nr:uncharacterized protein LOC113285687 [Papaver somniferum]
MYNERIKGDLDSISMVFTATKCWFIWKERFLRVFENKCRTPEKLALDIQRHYEYWHPLTLSSVSPSPLHNSIRIQSRPYWNFPIRNFYKLNCDASWISANTNAGYGFILRNWSGSFRAVGMGSCRTESAEEAEVVALLQATQWAITHNLQNLTIERDNLNTIKYLQGTHTSIGWKCLEVLDEVKKLTENLISFGGFHLVDRKANKAAD